MGSNGVLVSANGCLDYAAKRKWCGSNNDEGFWKQNSSFDKLSGDFCDNDQNMLSFSSSPKLSDFYAKDNGELESKNLLQNFPTLQNFQHSNSFYSKNQGYSCNIGGMNATSMYFMNGVKGAFTSSQWFELEQQALIYKYILANEPIPPNLLIPIRRAFELAGFSSFPAGLLRPNLFGWGPFHLGLANSTDPEVGRCRRTDGKKWRCSRDAVPDQKYCERHINRGRHRSRKPVEGHPVSGGTTNKSSNSNTSTSNVMNMTSSSSALVVPGGGPANSFSINLSQSKDLQLQPVTSNHFPFSLVHRSMNSMLNKTNSDQRMQNTTGLDFLSSRISQNSRAAESTFSIAESAAADFPFLTSDATILNTTQGCSYASRTYIQSQHSPRLFTEDDPSSNLWPKLETQTNTTTKLSMSIPPADFMSSTSSPTEERMALSPLRLSQELDPAKVHSSLGLDTVSNEQSPISWEASLGGPLGEVLKNTTSNSLGDQSKSTSALSLLSKASEGSSQLASSPTDVLQRTSLGYFSNSSAGSSPRAENGRALEGGILSGDLIGFTLGSSSSLSRCSKR